MSATEATNTSSEEAPDETRDSSPPMSNALVVDGENNNEESSLLDPELPSTRRSALQRLNREQRMRVLFGLLFHRIQNRYQLESDSISTEHPHEKIQPPNHDLRVLKGDQNEISQNVVCRFCLGQAGDNEEEEEEDKGEDDSSRNKNSIAKTKACNPFVSPCNCSGGQEWVHLRCFRRWQCQAASSNSTQSASKICSVCRCAYLLPPLSMNDDAIQPGALLVYMDDDRPSSFQKSLILILDHSIHGTTGLIVNVPLSPEDLESGDIMEDENVLGRRGVSWRKGGPVCGGRLGISRYLIAHTLNKSLEADYDDQQLVSHSVISSDGDRRDTEELPSNLPRKLQFVYDERDMKCPASFRADELGKVMNALLVVGGAPQTPEEEEVLSESQEKDEEQVQEERNPLGEFFVFSGYCRWRGGQLASELQHGVWSVCNHVRPDEMLPAESSWNRLRNCASRLLSYEDLIQEDDAVLGNVSAGETRG
ncbi:MAG: hypothetical protein SGBAC_000511 [Bacillariaceae sp.]